MCNPVLLSPWIGVIYWYALALALDYQPCVVILFGPSMACGRWFSLARWPASFFVWHGRFCIEGELCDFLDIAIAIEMKALRLTCDSMAVFFISLCILSVCSQRVWQFLTMAVHIIWLNDLRALFWLWPYGPRALRLCFYLYGLHIIVVALHLVYMALHSI